MSDTAQTRTSRCDTCADPIAITAAPGQKWRDTKWVHVDNDDHHHDAVPELRTCVEATCPGCGYPEIGFTPQRGEFVCSRCNHTTTQRPKD